APGHNLGRTAKLRLVVGPFAQEGVDPSLRYLVSGFRHQLISGLVRFREWSVIDGARATAAQAPPIPEQARYLVSATSYPANDRIQLILTLSDQVTGEYIWSEDHAADLEGWFATQRLVVRRMAVALNVHLSAERLTRIVGEPE